ncbi:MAG: allantoinase AllB [Actinobacteria bacterium]|nr:allantoinase AllB [Actinomycetota bacterium]
MPLDLVLRGRRVVTPQGERAASLGVLDGRIVVVGPFDADLPARTVVGYDADVALLPGVVDTHVHLQDPGTPWEGFGSGTLAAAAGGVTTLVDMPVDSCPATVDAASFAAKTDAARGRCHVDVAFWGGLTPLNRDRLPELAAAGVLGLKAFLTDPGAPDFPPLPVADLTAAAHDVARLGLPLLVHAEHPDVGPVPGRAPSGPVTRYADHLDAHPPEREAAAVDAVVTASARSGCRLHVVHVSTAGGAQRLRAARAADVPVTGETCPHLLCLVAEDVPDGAVEYAVGPPLRDRANAAALWEALLDGTLDMVVSDHSPSGLPERPDPAGDFATAAPGIASVELSLPVVWTAARGRGLGLTALAGWMSAAPARLAGLQRSKGAIEVGRDADVVVLDPDATFVVDPGALHQRQRRTPYTGRTLHGVVRETWLRGTRAGTGPPQGRLLLRPG